MFQFHLLQVYAEKGKMLIDEVNSALSSCLTVRHTFLFSRQNKFFLHSYILLPTLSWNLFLQFSSCHVILG
jgi:hypothetical protein